MSFHPEITAAVNVNMDKRTLRRCEEAMAHATDYAAWRVAAQEHDRLSGAADGNGTNRPITITR